MTWSWESCLLGWCLGFPGSSPVNSTGSGGPIHSPRSAFKPDPWAGSLPEQGLDLRGRATSRGFTSSRRTSRGLAPGHHQPSRGRGPPRGLSPGGFPLAVSLPPDRRVPGAEPLRCGELPGITVGRGCPEDP